GALERALSTDAAGRMTEIVGEAVALAAAPAETVGPALRRLKAEAHLLIALADLGGVWGLDGVTGAMTRFADAALQTALAVAVRAEASRGRLSVGPDGGAPGLFVLAMGKHGAHELNYSSDIDVSFFFDGDRLPVATGADPQAVAVRLAQAVSNLLNERTTDGYVLRTDLRLRPDPGSTPPAVSVAAALVYYETVGQNWERAAFIKARVAAGDREAGEAFLSALGPFIWRRSLDYAAIADVHSIKRQILAGEREGRIRAQGADLKRGRGGIREIEFYVQTQQLILGGRDPTLRSSRTLEALAALAAAGHVEASAADELAEAYRRLRAWEHRIQMLRDEQTHRLPVEDAPRRAVAALSGFADLGRFDRAVARTLAVVDRRYAALFAEEEPLSSRFGSLVFTGVEDDEETLRTLARMGFADPVRVSSTIRDWHHGRIRATRMARSRELFTRLAPRLLEAARRTGAPDAAFIRFADFFTGLGSSVQVQSLFLAEPALFELVVEVMAFAPDLARTLSRRPEALDVMLDAAFFAPLDEVEPGGVVRALTQNASTLEAAMEGARRAHREQSFRIGVQVLTGATGAEAAGRAYTDLAYSCIGALAPAALAEVERGAGAFPGEVAVLALGKAGSREMTARSDLDLTVLYAAEPGAVSAAKGWRAETVYGRFAQRLIAALSAPTEAGALYSVDMQLRPSGADGPVAVSLAAFSDYHAREAETWEALALIRARVVWASTSTFAAEAAAALEAALRRPRDPAALAREVAEMRALMTRERPASGFWDLKLSPGGLVDVEFAAQRLQLLHAPAGGPLEPGILDALAALGQAKLAPPKALAALRQAWALQQSLSQLLKAALDEGADPAAEPEPFRRKLARLGGARSFAGLEAKVRRVRHAALAAVSATERATPPVQRTRVRDETLGA
ncbi:MAG: bifunctional [glutamine synthetase] adenylyltransferase/[glutamine synthetase]-adenylyl-L-tyrosine phosphorylase, partial [Pseudomonadota bacterium]|nr:bifunctional [glutamine synthetase] adenylyltransferase/[glutamine synthetase]-adenylyl-L-tyrosine phosphorylase [Pseudomonadota bacterium]